MTGQKFYFLKNEAVLLELALIQFAMQKLVARGYVPVITPDLARVEVLEGIGFMPRDPNPETRQTMSFGGQGGQGGFGVSKYFPRPSFQNGLATSATRSVPDVVINADPIYGAILCQASDGGCPTRKLYGGTSMATPYWAAIAATINQRANRNIGDFNALLYPLANTIGFHSAAALGSDFAHVGLGSPKINTSPASIATAGIAASSAVCER